MVARPELRITSYRDTAAALRRQAGELRSDQQPTIKQLLALADGWDRLADGVEKEKFKTRSAGESAAQLTRWLTLGRTELGRELS